MDYFSAAASILFALYASTIRLFHLYPTNVFSRPLTGPASLTIRAPTKIDNIRALWAALCMITFIMHISYLSLLPRFDYTYNVIFNLVLGMTHNLLWLIYASPWPLPRMRLLPSGGNSSNNATGTERSPHAKRAVTVVLLTTAATALELFDFPPLWRTVDAHSLWHLATALILPLWYRFLVDDSLDLIAALRGSGGGSGTGRGVNYY
jgi:post-GPI attachment to proteins factor 3